MNRIAEAVQKLNEVYAELPRAAFRVREALEEAKNLIPYTEEEEPGFSTDDPINLFAEEAESIISEIERNYGESEERKRDPITEKDLIGHKIDVLRVKMGAFVEYAGIKSVLAPVLEQIEEKLEKISTIYPDRLDFKRSVDNLQEDYLLSESTTHIDNALELFNQGRYADSIRNCGLAGEHLTNIFAKHLTQTFEIEIQSDGWWSQLEVIRRRGLTGTTTRTLEWYVFFLLQNIYWLRNVSVHSGGGGGEEALPGWMREYRKSMINRVEHARVAMICTLQAAITLQYLSKNDNA